MEINYSIIKAKITSPNRSVTVRRLTAARLRKIVFGLRPLHDFSTPHFFAPVKMLRIFPYRAQKNVSYRRNDKGHNYGYAKDIGNEFVQRHRKHLEGNFKPDQEIGGSGQCRLRGSMLWTLRRNLS